MITQITICSKLEVESEADGAFRALQRRQVRTSPLARIDDLVQD